MTGKSDLAAKNKDIVFRALTGVMIHRDKDAHLELVAKDYKQHNPNAADGTDGISDFIASLGPDFTYQPGIIVAQGDYVMIHGRYTGLGPKPKVAVDIFRVENGKIVEHWDVLQEEVLAANTASGNAMFTRA